MNNVCSDENCNVTLDLGQLQLSLTELLGLRPGNFLRFEKPACFQGVLRLNGHAWATVNIEIGKEDLSINVVELNCLPPLHDEKNQINNAHRKLLANFSE